MGYFIKTFDPYWKQRILEYEESLDKAYENITDRKVDIDSSMYKLFYA